MSIFFTITFDLNNATTSLHGNNVYTKITGALDELCYFKNYRKSSRKTLPLPANTYITEFENNGASPKEVLRVLKRELRKVLRNHRVEGRYFISVGENSEIAVECFD